jgi:hypothetical protein
MQHPFAGMLPPEGDEPVSPHGRQSRRSTLARMIGALGGLGCVVWGQTSRAAQKSAGKPTTMRLGEEGGSAPPPQKPGPPRVSTRAAGEEGGNSPRPKQPGSPRVPTRAAGEEGAGGKPPQVTSMGLGEEGGGTARPPQASTMALGEEGGAVKPATAPSPAGGDAFMQFLYGDLFLD